MANVASITELYNAHPGVDIWVLASGPSAGYVEPAFFANKITVGVNYAWVAFPVDYVVVKEQFALNDAVESGQCVIASRHHCGNMANQKNKADGHHYIFDHLENRLESVEWGAMGSMERLVVSFSTITTAMHLAAYMGAENIILVGHDCGSINGHLNIPDYWEKKSEHARKFAKQNPEFYKTFLSKIEPQTIELKKHIKRVYGCNVYSLNPWINLGLEGNNYASISN